MGNALPVFRLGYRPALDGLRGVAILLVVLNHARVPGWDGAGTVGVTAFFVLSGFLITVLLLEERDAVGAISLLPFYRRRALRLLPALAILLTIAAAAYLVTGRPGRLVTDVLPPALYVANFARAAGDTLGALGHTWSLAVEEQFYLVWPLLLVLLPRRWLLPFLVVAIPVSFGLRLVSPEGLAAYGPHTNAYSLLAGALLAYAARSGRRSPAWFWVPGFGILGLAVALPQAGLLDAVWRQPVAVLGASFVVAAIAAVPTHRGPLTWRWLVVLGGISYGLYLWHYFLISIGVYVGAPRLLMAAISLPVAFVSYRYVEARFLRMKRHPRPERRPGGQPEVTGEVHLSSVRADGVEGS